MLRFAVIVLTFVACGCVSTREKLTLSHEVEVPSEYRSGNFFNDHPGYMVGNSTIERYVDAYERGWSIAVQRYAKNIEFDDPSPLGMSGWMEEVVGGDSGYSDGREWIQVLIRSYGKQKVSDLLNQYALPEDK
jgi:hypothetical protein